jgi:hypothetical protein
MAKLNSGTRIYGNVTIDTFATATGNITGGNILTAGLVSATGAVTAASVVGGVITGSSVSVTGAVTGASVVGGVMTGTSLSVTGNTTGGNLITGGSITATGIATSTGVILPPWNLGAINIATVGGGATASGRTLLGWNRSSGGGEFDIIVNRNGGSTGGFSLYEWANTLTDTTALVFNVTAAGATSAIGNITGANLRTAGLVSATGTVTGSSFSGAGTGLTGTAASLTVGTATLAGTVTTAAQPNITSVGTLTSLTMGGLLTGYSSTNTDVNTANDGGSFSARGNASTIASMTFHRTGAYAINMGLGVDNVFRIGGWSAANNCMQLSGTGAMTILSSLTLNSANGVTAIVNGGSNGVGNIGSSTTYFNTVFAKATSAQYADVAEKYTADADYPVGTVLRIGGIHEVSQTNSYHATNIVGTVSDKPAYVMNSGLAAEHVAVVALLGRVPCRVTGKISKGDLLVSSKISGVATVLDTDLWAPGCIIGKSLEDYDGSGEGVIEIVVGRS